MSVHFYNQNAEKYFNDTYLRNVALLYEPFLKDLLPNSKILDLGCGSGRDSKYFQSLGFAVTAVDGAERLAKLASEHLEFAVIVSDYSDLKFPTSFFSGIWCCASLLHLNDAELFKVLKLIDRWLAPNGVFYSSYKYGDSQWEESGRCFYGMNECKAKKLILNTDLIIKETWITFEKRQDEEVKWFNVCMTKKE